MYRVLTFGVPLLLMAAMAAPLYSAEDLMLLPEEETIEILLLRQKSVCDEIKLSNEVADHVKTYSASQWKKAQEISKLSKAEQDAKFDELAKENQQYLNKNLTKTQRDRLEQITLQVAGLSCITRPSIAEKLKLTADQKQMAKQLQKQAQKDLDEMVNAKDSKEQKKEIEKVWGRNEDRISKLLTDSQKTTWKQMTGPEFKGEFIYASK